MKISLSGILSAGSKKQDFISSIKDIFLNPHLFYNHIDAHTFLTEDLPKYAYTATTEERANLLELFANTDILDDAIDDKQFTYAENLIKAGVRIEEKNSPIFLLLVIFALMKLIKLGETPADNLESKSKKYFSSLALHLAAGCNYNAKTKTYIAVSKLTNYDSDSELDEELDDEELKRLAENWATDEYSKAHPYTDVDKDSSDYKIMLAKFTKEVVSKNSKIQARVAKKPAENFFSYIKKAIHEYNLTNNPSVRGLVNLVVGEAIIRGDTTILSEYAAFPYAFTASDFSTFIAYAPHMLSKEAAFHAKDIVSELEKQGKITKTDSAEISTLIDTHPRLYNIYPPEAYPICLQKRAKVAERILDPIERIEMLLSQNHQDITSFNDLIKEENNWCALKALNSDEQLKNLVCEVVLLPLCAQYSKTACIQLLLDDQRLTDLERKLFILDERNKQVTATQLKQHLQPLQQQNDNLQDRLQSLSQQNQALTTSVNSLTTQNQALEMKLDALTQQMTALTTMLKQSAEDEQQKQAETKLHKSHRLFCHK